MMKWGQQSSHLKITQQIAQACSSGLRQMFGLQVQNATDVFMAIDRNGNGDLSSDEIFNGLKRLGASLSKQQVSDWIQHLDVDHDGSIDAVEFIMHVDNCTEKEARQNIAAYKPIKAAKATRTRKQKSPAASSAKTTSNFVTKKIRKLLKQGKAMVHGIRLRDAVSLFNSIDADFSRTLDKAEIAATLKALHIGISNHDLKAWLRGLDEDESGSVDAEEFLECILGRKPNEEELSRVKGGNHVDSRGNLRTDNLKKGGGSGEKQQNEAMTKQILLSMDSTRKRSVFGHFVTDARSLFHALDRDSSGSIDKSELIKGLRRMGVHASIKQMNQWVDHLEMNDEGEITKNVFIETLSHTNMLTKHIHELCHNGGRQLFDIVVTDAASFFFAIDEDKSGDLDLKEIKRGLKELRGSVGGGTITDRKIDDFIRWLDEDKSGDVSAIEFITKVDYCTKAEAEEIVARYKPVTHAELLKREDDEILGIKTKLSKFTHLRRGLWERGTSNEQEVKELLKIDRLISENEKKLVDIHNTRLQRDGPQKSEVGERIRSSITAQSKERHSAKELKQQQQKARRKSVALVNSLTPKLASLKTEESYVDTKGEEDGQMGQYTKKRLKNIPKKTKPVAFQAISMAIDAIIKSGQKKLNGHLLLDAESLFCALDVDFSGDVDRKELKAGLRKLKIGCTSSQLEAWIDALDVNGDGSIEQHEFVGFLEGSLDPESQKFLGDSAVSLTRPTSKPTSPLIVDKMLTGINNYCYQDIDHEFIEALQQLERLYIHRKAYQTKVTSGRGGSLARGVGVDLLLSLETVRNIDTKEKLINRMIASDPSNGDLENFVHAWRRMIDLEASSSVKKSLPSTVLYEVERKRRSVTPGGERPVAWKAAQSPAKSQFSFSGSLTESARGGKALENLTPELGERKRYHMKTADRIGLNQPSPPQTQQQQQQQPSNHPPLVLSPSNDRYVMSNRRGSDFGKYASPIIGRAPRVTVTTSSPIIEKSKRRIENAILKYCKNHV